MKDTVRPVKFYSSLPDDEKGTVIYFTPASWAVDQVKRPSSVVEDICKCRVGHPNSEFLKYVDALRLARPEPRIPDVSLHGCCGCCCNGHVTDENILPKHVYFRWIPEENSRE